MYRRSGIGLAGVVVVASLSPAPVEDLVHLLDAVPVALTVEAHNVNGGLGSLVCEVVAEHGLRCRVLRLGARDAADGHSGSESHLWERHGISADALTEAATRALDEE